MRYEYEETKMHKEEGNLIETWEIRRRERGSVTLSVSQQLIATFWMRTSFYKFMFHKLW